MASVTKAMDAAVAIKVNFSKFKPVRNEARKAPPVPISPAKNPDTTPPEIRFFLEVGILRLGFRKAVNENPIRKIPKISFIIS